MFDIRTVRHPMISHSVSALRNVPCLSAVNSPVSITAFWTLEDTKLALRSLAIQTFFTEHETRP